MDELASLEEAFRY